MTELLRLGLAILLWIAPLEHPAGLAAVMADADDGRPTWSTCHPGEAEVECTWLEVPIDYDAPESPTIHLSVRRQPAREDATRIGVLITIAGGPGQRGTLGVHPGAHPPAIEDRFDIVSWDPRGTSGDSSIDCLPDWDPYAGLDRTPDTAAERRALDERIGVLAERCRRAHADLLPFVGTLETALDLERLRQLLDEPSISLLGSSYGSQVALTYATLFPDRVRAIVIDGYSDPNLSPGDREVEQARAFERELDAMLAECDADPACTFSDEGGSGAALDRLLAGLDLSPIPADGAGTRWLSQSDAHEAIAGSLIGDRGARRRLLGALSAADASDGAPLLDIADDVRRSFEASGLNQGTFMAVYCADTSSYWDALSPDEVLDLARRVREVAPRLGPWLWSPPEAADLPPVGLCAMQPRPVPRLLDLVDAADAGPVLVLAASGDPTTPIEGARRAVDDLDEGVLVTL